MFEPLTQRFAICTLVQSAGIWDVETMADSQNYVADPYCMSDSELRDFAHLIYEECGIALTKAKKSMLSARLAKRLRLMEMTTYREYYKFVVDTLGTNDELVQLVDAVTTNTTHFFRESKHFECLVDHVLPRLCTSGETVNIWSAGCSTGQEPYSLAMVLQEYFSRHDGDYNIIATDISSRVLGRAKQAIYSVEDLENVPPQYKYRYMMRGKGAQAGYWRIVPELREKVQFGKINLVTGEFDMPGPIHIIFCRNVIIYFDPDTCIRLIDRFYDRLVPGGFLFIGHSETLSGRNDQFRAVVPTVYRKPEKTTISARRSTYE